jgi:serine/threonine protein kinase
LRPTTEGILHRDLKPQNIVVSQTNDVTLIDFGLARLQAGADAAPHTIKYIGARWYRAPELLCNVKE